MQATLANETSESRRKMPRRKMSVRARREAMAGYLFILPWNIKGEIVEQMSCIREWGGKFFVAIPHIEIL